MENINLIRKITFDFVRKTNLEFNDLFGEAALAYLEAFETYNADKGAKFTTHAHTCMNNRLINFCKYDSYYDPTSGRHITHARADVEYDINMLYSYSIDNQDPSEIFKEKLEEWPKDCREVATLFLDNAEDLMLETPNFRRRYLSNPYRTKQRLKKVLMKMEWDECRIDNAFSEMSALLCKF